jgi:NADH-quinone oxidoreductase subunit G
VQRATRAVFPPGEAREDWTIIRALSDTLGKTLPYDDVSAVRRRMASINPVFYGLNDVVAAKWEDFGQSGGQSGEMTDVAFQSPIGNFYMTDPISRASVTMAACTRAVLGQAETLTGTDG